MRQHPSALRSHRLEKHTGAITSARTITVEASRRKIANTIEINEKRQKNKKGVRKSLDVDHSRLSGTIAAK